MTSQAAQFTYSLWSFHLRMQLYFCLTLTFSALLIFQLELSTTCISFSSQSLESCWVRVIKGFLYALCFSFLVFSMTD